MIKIPPDFQISIGLVFVVISLLVLADGIGLTPDDKQAQVTARYALAENIALQVKIAIKRGDRPLIESVLQQTAKQNENILSIAIRKPSGLVAFETLDHNQHWGEERLSKSNQNKMLLPLVKSDGGNTYLEIAFRDIEYQHSGYWGVSRVIWLIGFIAIFGFFGFWFYLSRALKQLDPSQVVPARVRNALNIMAEGVLILDKRDHIVLANDAIINILGISENKLVGRKPESLGWRTEDDVEFPWVTAQRTGDKETQVALSLKLGKKVHNFSVNSIPIIDEAGKNQGSISSFDDVTELQKKNKLLQEVMRTLVDKQKAIESSNRELNFLASRDPLTNCYNRRSLFESMSIYFEKYEQNKESNEYCVIMCDIDHFKKVNDTYGHGVGDSVIKGVASILQDFVRRDDIVARFGGEEFCLVLAGINPESLQELSEKIREKIEHASFENVSVTSSFGLSSLRFGAKTPKDLIAQADLALYKSKNSGRNRVSIWDASLESEELPQAH